MILSLRRRHRQMFIALAIFLPVAFGFGIAARKPVPTVAALPAGLTATIQKFAGLEWENAGLFSQAPMKIRLLREQTSSGRYAVECSPAKQFVKPDLLVYWLPAGAPVSETISPAAILLGAITASPLLLPVEAERMSGSLLLFSLANGEMVDISKPFSIQSNRASAPQ